MTKKTTIHDIARDLFFTPGTASKALNDNPRISLETKRMVNEKFPELNYQQKNILSSSRSISTLDLLINISAINEVKPFEALQQRIIPQPFLYYKGIFSSKSNGCHTRKIQNRSKSTFY